MIIEISKEYCKEYYSGNYSAAIANHDFTIIDSRATANIKDYINRNKIFCKYFEINE